jgi:thymidylate synthase (FAD)
MSVKLISATKGSVRIEGLFGTDYPYHNAEELISFTARVSNPANQMNTESAPKLLAYLIKHEHWSPFEMAHMTVEIKTSRAIAAQILRHRSFSFQEFSQRYAKANSFVKYEARRQDDKNRQNSIDDMTDDQKWWFQRVQQEAWDWSVRAYDQALDMGIAKEQARFLLPLSTETTIYMCGSVRSWIHYIKLRTKPSTQKEHRDIALGAQAVFNEEFPNIAKALKELEG